MTVVSIEFHEMLQLVRAGDATAIARFVEEYSPFIRRSIRMRLARTALTNVADSVDICQSVFAGFLIRISAGEYECATDDELRKLLYSIAQHKFLALQRRELAGKRDRRLTMSLNSVHELVDVRQVDPHDACDYREMLARFESRLKSDEWRLYDLRRQGQSWNTIAANSMEDAAMLRKRLSRAVRRVALELGIENDDEKADIE